MVKRNNVFGYLKRTASGLVSTKLTQFDVANSAAKPLLEDFALDGRVSKAFDLYKGGWS